MLEFGQTAAVEAVIGGLSMTAHESMGILAGILATIDLAVYILAIFGLTYYIGKLRKRTVPNRVSWMIWAGIGWIVVFSYHETGATDTIWFPIVYAVGFTVIALLSIRYGEGGFNWMDGVCLTGALVAGFGWWWFRSPEIALVASLGIETFAAIPTIAKSWKDPSRESKFAWTACFLASIANLLAVDPQSATFWIVFFPAYMLVLNGLIAAPLYRR